MGFCRKGFAYYLMLCLCFLSMLCCVFVFPAEQAKAAPAVALGGTALVVIAAILVAAGLIFYDGEGVVDTVTAVYNALSYTVKDFIDNVSISGGITRPDWSELGQNASLCAVPTNIVQSVIDTWNELFGFDTPSSYDWTTELQSFIWSDYSAIETASEFYVSNYEGDILDFSSALNLSFLTSCPLNYSPVRGNTFPLDSSAYYSLHDFSFNDVSGSIYMHKNRAGGSDYFVMDMAIPLLGFVQSFTYKDGFNPSVSVYSPYLYRAYSGRVSLVFPFTGNGSVLGTPNNIVFPLQNSDMNILLYSFCDNAYSGSIDNWQDWMALETAANGIDYLPVTLPTSMSIDDLASVSQTATGQDLVQSLDLSDLSAQEYTDLMTGVISGQLEGINDSLGDTTANVSGIRGILASISSWLIGIFDTSAFTLDFSGFRNLILTDRFPFCIPFDFVACIEAFASASANYTFNINLDTEYFTVDHTVDLSDFAIPLAFFRYAATLWFTIVLITKTRSMIKW